MPVCTCSAVLLDGISGAPVGAAVSPTYFSSEMNSVAMVLTTGPQGYTINKITLNVQGSGPFTIKLYTTDSSKKPNIKSAPDQVLTPSGNGLNSLTLTTGWTLSAGTGYAIVVSAPGQLVNQLITNFAGERCCSAAHAF